MFIEERDKIIDKEKEQKNVSTHRNPQKPTHTHTHTCNFLIAIFLSVFSIFSVYSVPSFATNVDNGEDATCDEDTLESPTGPVRLRAEFTPEIINLKWYDENNNRINVASASNTCTYDTAISLPTNPTKTGYKFKGWKIVQDYDFSTLTFNACGLDIAQCSVGYCKGAYYSYNTFNQT